MTKLRSSIHIGPTLEGLLLPLKLDFLEDEWIESLDLAILHID